MNAYIIKYEMEWRIDKQAFICENILDAVTAFFNSWFVGRPPDGLEEPKVTGIDTIFDVTILKQEFLNPLISKET